MNEVKLYAERDLMEMDRAGNHYCRHVDHMTREKLHSKSDIAAELGWRDMQIANLKEQLTATTNSLTNAQEALKSAGIEADTVQAGVMGLKAQRDALAAENAVLKGLFSTKEFSTEVTDAFSDTAVLRIDDDDHHSWQWVDNEAEVIRAVLDAMKPVTPATDAYLNSVRAEGANAAASKIRKAIPAFKDIHCGAVKECADIAEMVATQFSAGNAGKDGSHD